jgi:anti-sigma B factor antagonist
MTIDQRRTDSGVVLEIHGALSAGHGEASLRRAIRIAVDEGARIVIVNLRDVSDIDSSGVAELASGHIAVTNRGGRLILCCLSKKLEHIFAITRLAEVFEIYPSEADATAARAPS